MYNNNFTGACNEKLFSRDGRVTSPALNFGEYYKMNTQFTLSLIIPILDPNFFIVEHQEISDHNWLYII